MRPGGRESCTMCPEVTPCTLGASSSSVLQALSFFRTIMSVLGNVGQTRPGRLADQPPLTSETAAAAAASAGSHGTPEQEVQRALQGQKVVVFSKLVCPKCQKAKQVLRGMLGESGVSIVELDQRPDGPAMQDALERLTGAHTVPRIFINGRCIGGSDELQQLADSGQLAGMLS